jgi:hypothetical protein
MKPCTAPADLAAERCDLRNYPQCGERGAGNEHVCLWSSARSPMLRSERAQRADAVLTASNSVDTSVGNLRDEIECFLNKVAV